MNKNVYLKLDEVSLFVDYFKTIVFGNEGTFCQKYKSEYDVSSFKQALQSYWWEGSDFNSSYKTIKSFSDVLKNAIKEKDELSALVSSIKILDWGGVVNRYSVMWLVDAFESNQLCHSLKLARDILNSGDDSELYLFENNSPLRSDSATTKLFSLASNESIIYDDRVGAAIAIIVRKFLEDNEINSVPDSLCFMRGPKKRNPSNKQYKFAPKTPGDLHATSNLRANWIVQEIVDDNRFNEHFNYSEITGKKNEHTQKKVRMIEAALFMIGYDINTIKLIAPKKIKANADLIKRINDNLEKKKKRKIHIEREKICIKDFEIDEAMRRIVTECKEKVKNPLAESKMKTAKSAYKQLDGYNRKQILWVFMEGCGLTKNGAATYYQKIRKLSLS